MGYPTSTRHRGTTTADVGEGIARADVNRDDVFLATKVWIDNLAPEDVKRTTRKCIDNLGVDGVDLLYVHWPAGVRPRGNAPRLQDLYDDGLVRNVEVSNFLPEQLEAAAELLGTPIFAYEFELHPFLQQAEHRQTCDELGINVVAYSPLSRGPSSTN